MPQLWEYNVLKLEDEARKRVEDLPKGEDLLDYLESPQAARDLAKQILNELGTEGWELVLMEHDTMIFKRQRF